MILSITDYPPHKHTVLRLPDTGLVVVQGRNESGKSTLLEAYCATLWGRSLRGASAWRGPDYKLDLDLPELHVHRSHGLLEVNGASALKSTKKQPELVSLVGSWDNFTRIRCFDADLTARFGTTTDAERKRLLERLCGLDKLEDGLKRCRADMRDTERALVGINSQIAIVDASIAERPKVAPPSVLPDELQRRLSGVEQQLRGMAKREATTIAELQELQRRDTQLKRDRCPVCGSPIAATLRQRLHEDLEQGRQRLSTAAEARKAQESVAKTMLAELQTLRAQQAEADAYIKAAARVAELTTKREAHQQERVAIVRRTQLLARVERFLDSARPRLLTVLLASLATSASAWLATMTDKQFEMWVDGDDVKIRLGVFDYKELNRGHRRRLDLAIMLALSQLHSAPVRGPIWMDEPLDGLDADGAEATSSVLEAVAQHELVIMLTHSVELAERLRGIQVRVRDGRCLTTNTDGGTLAP